MIAPSFEANAEVYVSLFGNKEIHGGS